MILKNVASQGIYLFAWDPAANSGAGGAKTGDAANITGSISKDGAAAAPTGTAHPTEIGGGIYWQPLAQAETNANAIALYWASTTSGIQIDPVILTTTAGVIPAAAAGATGGLLVVGTGTGAINPASGKVPATLAATDVTGNVASDLQTIKTQSVTCSAGVTVNPNVGTATAALAVDASGRVDVGKWAGSAVTTPAVAGVPVVDLGYVLGVAAEADTMTDATVAAAVWDLATSGHTTSGTFGAAAVAAGSAGDPWSTSLPGAYGSGTAGYLVGNNLDAAVSTRSTLAAADVLGAAVEGSITLAQAMAVVLAAEAGKVSGSGTGTITIRSAGDTADRIVAAVDGSGNRTTITLTLP